MTVAFADPDEQEAQQAFRKAWEDWDCSVPLVTLPSTHRSIAKPIVQYLCDIEAKDKYHKLVVLIPEVQPRRFWDYLLFNQRGVILDRAIRRGTANVVLCHLRYRLQQFAADETTPRPAETPPRIVPPAAAPPTTAPSAETPSAETPSAAAPPA